MIISSRVRMNSIITSGRIYRHLRSGSVYRIVGTGHPCKDAMNRVVIYEQLYDGKLQDAGTFFPAGTWWTRDLTDFCLKFVLEEKN